MGEDEAIKALGQGFDDHEPDYGDEARAPISVLSPIWDNDHVANGPLNSHTYTIHVTDEGGELVQELQVTRGHLRAIAQRDPLDVIIQHKTEEIEASGYAQWPIKLEIEPDDDCRSAIAERDKARKDLASWKSIAERQERELEALQGKRKALLELVCDGEGCELMDENGDRVDIQEVINERNAAIAERDKALEERDEARLRIAYCEGKLSRAGLRTLGEAIDLRAFDRVPWRSILGKAVSLGFDPANTITSRSQLVQFILEKVEADPSEPSIQDWIEREEAGDAASWIKELKALVEATDKLRHWHDWGRQSEGMVVSSESVRNIWEQRGRAKIALMRFADAKCDSREGDDDQGAGGEAIA